MFHRKTYFIYILASAPRGTLHVGMTSDLCDRTRQHRAHLRDGFTKRYWTNRLVYDEAHGDASVAARRERTLERWRRSWKIELVERANPTWKDRFQEFVASHGYEP